jgi:hypothetical protein
VICPLSPLGRKPLGIDEKSDALKTMVAIKATSTVRGCAIAARSVIS